MPMRERTSPVREQLGPKFVVGARLELSPILGMPSLSGAKDSGVQQAPHTLHMRVTEE